MQLGELISEFRTRLTSVMDASEADAVTFRAFEDVLGIRRSDTVIRKQDKLDENTIDSMKRVLQRLEAHEPVQYVTGKAPFMEWTFEVRRDVLIPRPETEELVRWMLETIKPASTGNLIDLGTGSGCIPIAFKKNRPTWKVYAIDVSPAALEVAARNAQTIGADILLESDDILLTHSSAPWRMARFDVIISNPPYIPAEEMSTMHPRVVNYEPSLALFTPPSDPLIFYKSIRDLAIQQLEPNGWIFLEVHENFSESTLRLFQSPPFKMAEIKEDLFGKERMIRVRM